MSGPPTDTWTWPGRPGKLTQADLVRAAAIGVELMEKARAGLERIAVTLDDEPDGNPVINEP